MASQSLGKKRACPSCDAHFYDLNKNPASCPKCTHSFDPTEVIKKSSRAASAKVAKPVAPKKEEALDEDLDDELEDIDLGDELPDIEDDGEDDPIEDTSDLGDDDDLGDLVKADVGPEDL